jgi:hypothetical protein
MILLVLGVGAAPFGFEGCGSSGVDHGGWRRIRSKRKRKSAPNQLRLGFELMEKLPHFFQRRFYDFNVWSHKKKLEKLKYMHFNPVKRGLVKDPKDWPWSSCGFYEGRKDGLLKMDWE